MADRIGFWMPWEYPDKWHPLTYLLFDRPERGDDGKLLIQTVSLKNTTRHLTDASWIPIPMKGRDRPEGYSSAAAIDSKYHPSFELLNTVIGTQFAEFTKKTKIRGGEVGGSHWLLPEASIHSIKRKIEAHWQDTRINTVRLVSGFRGKSFEECDARS